MYKRQVREVVSMLGQTAYQPEQEYSESISSTPNSIKAVLSFSSVKEWVKTKATLDKVSYVNFVRVHSLSPQQAMLEINFIGEVDQLREALRQSGINMLLDSGSYYNYNQHNSNEPIYQLSLSRYMSY